MKERPIPFSGPMVRAILEGRKTQTRRVISCANSTVDGSRWAQERFAALDFSEKHEKLAADPSYPCGCLKYVPCSLDDDPTVGHRVRSRWNTGDRLWVREAWKTAKVNDHLSPAQMVSACRKAGWKSGRTWAPIEYLADGRRENWDTFPTQLGKFRNSRFMPRDYSRITLEITEVRVQRLQEISEEDARAEGIYLFHGGPSEGGGYKVAPGEQEYDTAAESFRELWDSINAKLGCGWSTNPWVWALTFRRVA